MAASSPFAVWSAKNLWDVDIWDYIVKYSDYVKKTISSAFMPPDACQSALDPTGQRAKRNCNNYICNMHTLCGIIMHHRLSFHLIFRLLYQIPGTIANFFALYFPPSSFLYLRSFFLAQIAI